MPYRQVSCLTSSSIAQPDGIRDLEFLGARPGHSFHTGEIRGTLCSSVAVQRSRGAAQFAVRYLIHSLLDSIKRVE